jgi:hypothetical protein
VIICAGITDNLLDYRFISSEASGGQEEQWTLLHGWLGNDMITLHYLEVLKHTTLTVYTFSVSATNRKVVGLRPDDVNDFYQFT